MDILSYSSKVNLSMPSNNPSGIKTASKSYNNLQAKKLDNACGMLYIIYNIFQVDVVVLPCTSDCLDKQTFL